jgi:hypothetical protein
MVMLKCHGQNTVYAARVHKGYTCVVHTVYV